MTNTIRVKIHSSYREVIAVSDTSLIGKYFEEGNRQLDVRGVFFKGEDMEFDKVVELMKRRAEEDATFNIVGPLAVKAAQKAGLVTPEGIATVQGVPFALVLL